MLDFKPDEALSASKCRRSIRAGAQAKTKAAERVRGPDDFERERKKSRRRWPNTTAKRNFATHERTQRRSAAAQRAGRQAPFCCPETCGQSSALRFPAGNARRAQIMGSAERCSA